ncbi:MAG: D-hexose-6-phosphate mutarotase [Actinomycetota bacterium]|nr:D-hexose-6-phosphate mutarotase [Actinomycetota bacterium]
MANESIPSAIALSNTGGTGTVFAHGAHLTSWIPTGNEPVIWMSSLARFETGIAIRGGVPIIFPWFGAGRSGDLTPAHGFARTQPWRLIDQGQAGNDAIAQFSLNGAPTDDPNFPFAFTARYEIRLGDTLQLSFTVENTDKRAFSYEAALHAYFHVSDIRKIALEGLDGCSYLDQADPNGLNVKTQAGDVTFTNETDRIYTASGQVRVIDQAMDRVLIIDKENSASTVVWNPWVEKAKRIRDFGDEEWPSMLCVEGGNLREEAVQLQPGHSHEMRYSVRVSRHAHV